MTDKQRRQQAAEALGTYAGTREDECPLLVEALVRAFSEEALEVLTGGPPPYGSAADSRAARLARITRHFAVVLAEKSKRTRALSRLEVQALFRVAAPTAASTDRRMRAMWPDIDLELLKTEVVAGAESVTRPGSNDDGYRIRIKFSSDASSRAAETLLERNGLLGLIDTSAPKRVLDLPFDGKAARDRVDRAVSDILGLELP